MTTHMCRGNFRSGWAAEGGYDFVAEALLNDLEVDGFFMEWDDERSGGFEPLRFLPKGEKQVVLGLVTTKRGELESRDELLRRIEEASRFAPARAALPLAAVRLLLDGRGEPAERGGAVGEAAADRRGRRGRLGVTPRTRSGDRVFDVLRRRGLTTLFSNPGSTEVPFLAGLPDDLRFVLALHEGSVVGLATGYALGRGEPALALLHTTAGLGNAVGAIATARVNRAPLVVVVGQQDRRHLVFEPFLTGRLQGLAGEYPVWSDQPVRAQDVPGAIDRAYHEAATRRGPALVVVPMDDWLQPADEDREDASPGRVVRAAGVDPAAVDELAAFLEGATAPALVVGAGTDGEEAWAALVELAERLVAPVFQESFAARAGFPQDHRLFAGFLPADRPRLRELLAPYDAVLVARGAGLPPVAVRARPAHRATGRGSRSSATSRTRCTAARPSSRCWRRRPPSRASWRVACRSATPSLRPRFAAPPAPEPPAEGEPLTAGHVLAALAARLPEDAVRRRGGARRPAGAPRALAGATAARLPQRGDGRARVRRPRRSGRADGAAGAPGGGGRRRRLVALRDPGALERRAGAAPASST